MMFLVGVGAGLCSSGSAAPVGADRLYMSVRADMFGILVGMVSSTVGDTVTVVGVVLPDGLCPATGILSVSGFVELCEQHGSPRTPGGRASPGVHWGFISATLPRVRGPLGLHMAPPPPRCGLHTTPQAAPNAAVGCPQTLLLGGLRAALRR